MGFAVQFSIFPVLRNKIACCVSSSPLGHECTDSRPHRLAAACLQAADGKPACLLRLRHLPCPTNNSA
jgi:hypothetical protein